MPAMHALYLRTPEAHRWVGPPGLILTSLRSRAWTLAQGATAADRGADRDWSWTVLPTGLVVGLRFHGELGNRREVRVARPKAATDDARAFERDALTLLAVLGIEPTAYDEPAGEAGGWRRQAPHPNDAAKRAHAIRLIELRPGEIEPGKARCYDCLRKTGEVHEVAWFAGGGIRGQRCNTHAMMAGRREASAYAEQRQLKVG